MNEISDEVLWDSYNNLLLGPDSSRLQKILVRYELYNMTRDVPGDIFECGVFKGAGLFFFAKLLNLYEPHSYKKVVGFDTFTASVPSLLDYEKKRVHSFIEEAKYVGIKVDELYLMGEHAGIRNRIELVEGNLEETASKYVQENLGVRISLINLDLDTYAGTKAVLENFYPLISRGGILILDEYGVKGFGDADAIDEFFADKSAKIQTVPFSAKPTAYIVKP